MKRILVIGCSGAGKTTFSRMLGEKLSLPVYHLDQLYWKPDWVESNKNEFTKKQTAIITGERWIIDGNYSSTLELRFAKARDRLPQSGHGVSQRFPRHECRALSKECSTAMVELSK